MQNFLSHVILNEEHKSKIIYQEALNFKRDALEPVLSKDNIDLHYGKLYKGYVDRYNKGQGDPAFNEAGAFLHDIYFSQLQKPGNEKPNGNILRFIEKNFKNWETFKREFEIEAMKIQGSGWIYLAENGEIKTIKNHQIKKDIILLIDWWEHAFILDYGTNKKSYLQNHWKIINWKLVASKINLHLL